MNSQENEIQLLPGCRPRLHSLTILMAVIEGGRAIHAMQIPLDVATLARVPVTLDFIGGVLWGVLFTFTTYLLLRHRRLAHRVAAWSLVAYTCYNMLRWSFYVQADYDRARLPVLLAVTSLATITLVAFLIRNKRAMLAQVLKLEKKVHDGESHGRLEGESES